MDILHKRNKLQMVYLNALFYVFWLKRAKGKKGECMSSDSFEASRKRSDDISADLKVNPEKYTMLTGDRPTGRLHLGHYFGTIKERVVLQELGITTRVVIADYQVITDRDTTEHIQDNVYNMVIDYLACGLDPEKTLIFTHSAVPALNQLMLPFLSLVSEAELLRNPTVKSEMEASGPFRFVVNVSRSSGM